MAQTLVGLGNRFGLQVVQIDGYPIDATLSEDHTFSAEVTEYPVEKGADLTDHVRSKPLKITLDCVVSDSPIGVVATHATRKDGSVPSSAIYERLLDLRSKGEPITIITSLNVYKNMVLSDLSVPRASGEPHQLHFRAQFTEVIIVTNNRTTVKVATRTGGQSHLGWLLAHTGRHRVLVFTVPANTKGLQPGPGFVSTDKYGQHWQAAPPITPAYDGFVDETGYHPFIGFYYPPDGRYYYSQKTVAQNPAIINGVKPNTQGAAWDDFVTAGQAVP